MAARKVFHDSIVALPDQPGVTSDGLMVNLAAGAAAASAEPLTLLFAMAMPDELQAQLEAKVAAGEVVPHEELASRYRIPQAQVDKLQTWLRNQGYDVLETTPDGTGVYARAGADTIAKSLQVTMTPVMKEGVTYIAAKDAPSLPDDVGGPVRAIVGLQPYRRAHKHLRAMVSETAPVTATAAPAPAIANAPPYLPREILAAYGAAGLTLTGAGQTIAILIDTVPHDADLQAFWTACGLGVTMAQVTKINVSGGTLPPVSGEETLDASWTSGIAPGAKIRIYASGTLQFTALDRALDRIIADLPSQPGLRQLSISLGLGETYMSAGEAATQHAKFLRLAAAGVNVFVSTGDAGSNPDQTGHNPTGPLQAEYESTDTSVVAVGGTSLRLTAAGGVQSETAWSGSGGGKSILFARPAWQAAPGAPAGTNRLVPDVCAAADPNTGGLVILNGTRMQYGGTSWSAPIWAGICALLNQARAQAGQPLLGYLNPMLYPLAGSASFRDITVGANGAYHAGPGYDLVTGLGAPNVSQLAAVLARPSPRPIWATGNIGEGAGAIAWLTGDITGDGKAEQIQLWNNGGRLGVIIYRWNGAAMSELWSTGNIGEGAGAVSWQIADINGDGKAEIIQLWSNGGRLGVIVYHWNGSALVELWNTGNIGEGSGAVSWQVGDINGDGKAELMQLWSNNGRLGVIVYHWNGSALTELWNTGNIGEGSGAVTWQVADINGDGKAELVQLWNNGGRLGVIIYRWNGSALVELWNTGNIGEGAGAVTWQIADLNGDGKAELLQCWSNNGRLGMIEYGWSGGALRELFNTGDIGEGSGAVAWATARFLGARAQLLQLWNNGGRLGAILYDGFR